MGIKICPQCGGKVSDARNDCPHCHYDFTLSKKCPDCEEIIDISLAECPICGHIFEKTTSKRTTNTPAVGQAETVPEEQQAPEVAQAEDTTKEEHSPEVVQNNNELDELVCPYCNSIESLPIGNSVYLCMVCKNKYMDTRGLPTPPPLATKPVVESKTAQLSQTVIERDTTKATNAAVDSKITKTAATEAKNKKLPKESTPVKNKQKQPRKKDTTAIWLWVLWLSLGFTMLSYLVTATLSLLFTGSLHRMFIYIMDGYIAGFICMGVGFIGFIISLFCLCKNTKVKLSRIISLALMTAILFATFTPLVSYNPFRYTKNTNGTYNVADYDYGYTVNTLIIPSTYKGIPVTSIGNRAFHECSSLTSVVIGARVKSIGSSAFSGCSSLKRIIIPDGVTSIGSSAFSGCSSLTSITIPDSVTNIGNYVFYNCSGLTSITIPDSVTSIGDYAFSSCSGLTSITISDSVTSIGDYAFCNCSNLTNITIPDSVTSIGGRAFYNCSNLTIYCEAESQPSGWDFGWNDSECPVVWGYKG